jgi:hypothetical protein
MEVRANANDNPGRINYVAWLTNTNPDVDFIFIFPEGSSVNRIAGKNVFINTYDNLVKNT